jgi:hypothetical protein
VKASLFGRLDHALQILLEFGILFHIDHLVDERFKNARLWSRTK